MKLLGGVAEVRTALAPERMAGHVVGLVPTMGALHEGHLSLVRAAREGSDIVVVSVFVNPLQFGAGEDLETYPRDLERDLSLLDAAGVYVVFAPSEDEMYQPDRATSVHVTGISDVLEGLHRPGHFDGVATVVSKLFNIVAPDIAYFGQKDAQQVAVIKRMVKDLDFDLEVVVSPIVREPDGLAMSSRNAYLSRDQRREAAVLYRALSAGAERFRKSGDLAATEDAMRREFDSFPAVSLDYAAVRDPDDFGPPRPGRPVLLAVAARLGNTRLIDNMILSHEET